MWGIRQAIQHTIPKGLLCHPPTASYPCATAYALSTTHTAGYTLPNFHRRLYPSIAWAARSIGVCGNATHPHPTPSPKRVGLGGPYPSHLISSHRASNLISSHQAKVKSENAKAQHNSEIVLRCSVPTLRRRIPPSIFGCNKILVRQRATRLSDKLSTSSWLPTQQI